MNSNPEEFEDNFESKRTINEVLDVETGNIIKSEDYFKLSEDILMADRRRLQEAIAGFSAPKYVCAYCQQLVKLSGRVTRRGQVSFFAHLHDSDDCEIKTSSNLSKDEIEMRKYGNIRESIRHIELKNQIAELLKTTPNVNNVEIEKRINSDIPFLHWRRPDVSAEYQGRDIVFELQLSTTFLSVVVDRDIFYRMNNTFIIWIFNFSDNQEYVNLNNLMCKDIYYSNKRNAFIFDEKAQRISRDAGELYLLCIWFEPVLENGVYKQSNDCEKKEYIKFSDLQFDETSYKLYYIDADALFAPFQRKYYDGHKQEYVNSVIDLERLNEIRLKKLAKKKKEKELLQKKKEEKIEETRELIRQGVEKLHPFQKRDKWGYESNGIVMLEPTFTEASEISEDGYALIQKKNKFGLVNQFGEIVLNCDYKRLIHVFTNKYLANRKNDWVCIDIQTKEEVYIHTAENKNAHIQFKNWGNGNSRLIEIENNIGILSNTNRFQRYDEIDELQDGIANASRDGYWTYFNGWSRKYTTERFVQGKTVYINEFGEELASDLKEIKPNVFKGTKYGKWGVETKEQVVIIPFIYDEITDFESGKFIAKKEGKYGYLDESGNILILFEYDEIFQFYDGKADAKKNGKYGYIDEEGNIIIPFEYDDIEKFIDGKVKVKKNGKYGYIDEEGNIIIPFEYDDIEGFIDGKLKAKKNGKYGYMDEEGNAIIPFEYDNIEEFIDGRVKAKKNYWEYGCLDENGNTLVPFEYDKIEIMNDNFVVIKDSQIQLIEHIGLKSQPVNCRIEGTSDFGVFANFDYFTGLLHISEIRRAGKMLSDFSEWGSSIVSLYILSVDIEKQRIGFSLLQPEGRCDKNVIKSSVTSYILGSVHSGIIKKIIDYGLFITLQEGIDVLLHISEIRRYNKNLNDFKTREQIQVKILSVDTEKNRLKVTLYQLAKIVKKVSHCKLDE